MISTENIPLTIWFLRYKSWLVILPGLDAGGTTGGWTIPFTGWTTGSFLGGARSTLTCSAELFSVFSDFMLPKKIINKKWMKIDK